MHALVRLSAAAVAAVVLANPASAQISFTGYTNGCFYLTGGPACSPETTPGTRTDVLGPLTYTNSTFNVTSSGGVAAIGEVPATPNVNNLGSISLPANSPVFNFNGNSFALNVFFTSPAGTSPTNTTFLATLTGNVIDNSGGVFFDFNNTPQNFTYNGGTFTLQVNDVSLTNTGGVNTVPLSGFINVSATTTVPEPGTYALMAAGLAGLFVTARRRRSV
jgi:hypothetical protein